MYGLEVEEAEGEQEDDDDEDDDDVTRKTDITQVFPHAF